MSANGNLELKAENLKVLLLENVHPLGIQAFQKKGVQVEVMSTALNGEALEKKLNGVHVLGIRSKTTLSNDIIAKAKDLVAVGCFCIGTNQVDLDSAKKEGIPVFNAPYGSTRSVVELVIGEIIGLARQLGQRSMEVHQGTWKKISTNCFEVRGKTLGIVGYGNIGTQVSTLAEALGMKVIYFDVVEKLSLGNAKPCASLDSLLQESDFVTLHVSANPSTYQMIGAPQLNLMKKGSYLINASRGSVVSIPALVDALRSGHLSGAAVDVYPDEPECNTEAFKSDLQSIPNVILTPHIGGSTEEAQAKIGAEVSNSLLRFVQSGSTAKSVNFPLIDLPMVPERHRLLHIHRNTPGVLRDLNQIISNFGLNILTQSLSTDSEIGYLVLDTDKKPSVDLVNAIQTLKTSIKVRLLS